MKEINPVCFLRNVLSSRPAAFADIKGSEKYPEICGKVYFYSVSCKTYLLWEIHGLPKKEPCGIFAFHIHEGKCCKSDKDMFDEAMSHYNPRKTKHPCHAGDLPPLFANDSCAFGSVLTERFKPCDVIGRTVIVHLGMDDFKTDPSGNSGERIACGEIKGL